MDSNGVKVIARRTVRGYRIALRSTHAGIKHTRMHAQCSATGPLDTICLASSYQHTWYKPIGMAAKTRAVGPSYEFQN